MARFSKDTLALDIARRVRAIQAKQNFDLSNGTAQLRGVMMTDTGITRCADYGALRALMNLANEFDLGDLVRDKVSQLDGGYIE